MDRLPTQSKKIFAVLSIFSLYCAGWERISNPNDPFDVEITIKREDESKKTGFKFPQDFTPDSNSGKLCKDLLSILEDLSLQSNLEIRFLSTNQTVEIISLDGIRNQWKKRWKIYHQKEEILPKKLYTGHFVCEDEKIEISYEDTVPKIPFSKEKE
jgi:hypothetical protein